MAGDPSEQVAVIVTDPATQVVTVPTSELQPEPSEVVTVAAIDAERDVAVAEIHATVAIAEIEARTDERVRTAEEEIQWLRDQLAEKTAALEAATLSLSTSEAVAEAAVAVAEVATVEALATETVSLPPETLSEAEAQSLETTLSSTPSDTPEGTNSTPTEHSDASGNPEAAEAERPRVFIR